MLFFTFCDWIAVKIVVKINKRKFKNLKFKYRDKVTQAIKIVFIK